MASDVQPKADGPIPKPQKQVKQTPLWSNLKRTPIRQVGKVTKQWLKTRQQWIALNPPDWLGNYTCGICGGIVAKEVMQLDHIEKRSTHPEKRFDLTNLRPTHEKCNYGRV